ncbi:MULTISPECIES: uracil-DNA glycosylase family protein [unclassified Coleofasciculus]|uniref:uracil-DNA glycosylase family protein n=1 Tax=unclassified Coleofasciculus TaxID=2692782 RepID=UPI00187E441C|nr:MULTISPECIES: uracil-DNA glycosylase family protein [unclassified Coleofasciculus]MBE9128691.1 uracil-DNA glycosylase family protein [Coleofasciculus sp. LEGE 07081]MBE9151477.1 uracil-DNA glycosylase family protein [Coleofasciculus sp. LEGE 07092]
MSEINQLINQIHKEAQREPFPIDSSIYQAAGLDPTLPILYAGNLKSSLCFFARDLGKDEVHAQQPLYGAAGRLVREGLYRAIYGSEPSNRNDLQSILDHVLLTNTVPYKPPGNKAYLQAVKKRFRPFLEQLLVFYWQGDRIMTLGNEAFKWFSPYAPKGTLNQFFKESDRYRNSIKITLSAEDDEGKRQERSVTLLPLPHPSPLNQQYYAQFPAMLQQRLKSQFR